MALRAECVAIANFIRELISDPYSTSMAFEDDILQIALDDNRCEVHYAPLTPHATYQAGGVVRYLTFNFDEGGWWDTLAEVVDSQWSPVTADTVDLTIGRWAFDMQPKFPLRVSGWLYDIYATAGDLCERRAITTDGSMIDRREGDTQYSGSQQGAAWRAQAKAFRAKARMSSVKMVRTDVTPGASGSTPLLGTHSGL